MVVGHADARARIREAAGFDLGRYGFMSGSPTKSGRGGLPRCGTRDRPLFVVVGRRDHTKPSPLLHRLAEDLSRGGASVCWFEARTNETSRLLDARIKELFDPGGPLRRLPVLRRPAKFLLLLAYPSRWGLFLRLVRSWHAVSTPDLRGFIRRLPAGDVCLLAHSAGCIVAAMVEDEPKVRAQVGFGYPFRHPDRGEEPYRTAPLANRRKPLLIIQGDRDAYGSAADARRYPLSPAIRFAAIDASHDYDMLPQEDYRQILALVRGFFEAAVPEAAPISSGPREERFSGS